MRSWSLELLSRSGTWRASWAARKTSKSLPKGIRRCYRRLLTLPARNSFVSYTTSQYKLHYYETPTNTKFVMLTDIKSPSMRIALQQIYINLYVEYGSYMTREIDSWHTANRFPFVSSRLKPFISGRTSRRRGSEQRAFRRIARTIRGMLHLSYRNPSLSPLY